MKILTYNEFTNEAFSIQRNAMKPSDIDSHLLITKIGTNENDWFVVGDVEKINNGYAITGVSMDYPEFKGWKLYTNNDRKFVGMSSLDDNNATQPIVGDVYGFAIKINNDIYVVATTLDRLKEKANDYNFYKELNK